MLPGMNKEQTRALWVTAFRDLATAISIGAIEPPTSAHLWTQYVSAETLGQVADNSGPTPLKAMGIIGPFPHVTVPIGQPLEIGLDWTYQADLSVLSTEDQQRARENLIEHNEVCVPVPYTPADPCAGGNCVNPVAHAEGAHDL
jgi:hypothetical protein